MHHYQALLLVVLYTWIINCNTIGTYTLTSGYYYFQLSIILPITFNNPTVFNSYTIYYPFTSANAKTNTYCCSFGGEGGYGGVTSNTAVTVGLLKLIGSIILSWK